MGVLSNLEPAGVFGYFEEICSIPHGSGNTKQISDYCVHFAKEHGLRYIQDDVNNVIIYKEGTPGYEESAPVIIQGHLDMVCEKTADCTIDFNKDGLSLCLEDGVISADKTTLGGDDGIAVAYALAILASDDIPHPPLEAVFTSDEEIGLLGAAALDCTALKGRTMINIDSEEEGYLLVSCAGGVSAICKLPIKREEKKGVFAKLCLNGLAGGHSGVEIQKERGNSNCLMGRALNELGKVLPFSLISVAGGLKDNAIPRETTAEILIHEDDKDALMEFVKKYQEIFAGEYSVADPNLSFTVSLGGGAAENVMDEDSKKGVIYALLHLPGGILRMSADIPGLVQTSLNMGVLKTEKDEAIMSFSLRSSLSSEKEALISRIGSLMELLGGSLLCEGDYPAWEYKQESRIRDLMVEVYQDMYGKKPIVQAIHAGLECGLFSGAMPDLDCISIGPDMQDVHTVNERMDVGSVARTWEFLLEVLKRLK